MVVRFLDYLQEEYVGFYKEWEVFVNPDSEELRNYKHIRFIADYRTKKFFITYELVLHEPFVKYLRSKELLDRTDKCFMGSGDIKNGKIDFYDFSYDWGMPPDQDMNKQFLWCQKYFTEDSIKRLWK